MNGGSELVLTGNHQVLNDDGHLVEASDLSVGSKLVKFDGTSIEIVKIERRVVTDDVYNILSSGMNDFSHFIFAEGLMVGDLLWENTHQDRIQALEFPKTASKNAK